VISRGIDIDNIDMVINFDVPNDAEDYIHRIGRTARASSEGEGVTFINEEDQFKFSKIEELIGAEIRKVALPDFLGEGPKYDPIKNKGKGQRTFGNKKGFKKR
jgi:superfamily II DNA/RNA helicase